MEEDASLVTFESDSLIREPWPDDVIDALGFDPRSPYVERFWLGVIGPSTTWLLRRIAAGLRPVARRLRDAAGRDGPGPRAGRSGRPPLAVPAHRQPDDPVRAGPGAAGRRRAGRAPTPAAAQPAADRPAVAGAAGSPRALAGRAAPGAAVPRPSAAAAGNWLSACSSWGGRRGGRAATAALAVPPGSGEGRRRPGRRPAPARVAAADAG